MNSTDLFFNEYPNFTESLLSIMITGGGFGFYDILKRPGASEIINDIISPYSVNSLRQFLKYQNPLITNEEIKSCSLEFTKKYLESLRNYHGDNELNYMVINSAITSRDYRKGNNRSYIAIKLSNSIPIIYRYDINKMNSEIHIKADFEEIANTRKIEDDNIAGIGMNLILNLLNPNQEKYISNIKYLMSSGEKISELCWFDGSEITLIEG